MGKIIALILAIFFLFVAVKACLMLPETQGRLKDAPFIDDANVHPELDGQTVIVGGKLVSIENAYDDELLLTLPSPKAVRYVEMLVEKHDNENGYYLDWEPVRSYRENEWLREKKLAGDMRLGGYRVDEELADMLSAGKSVTADMLDPDEVDALLSHSLHLVTYLGVDYFSELPRQYFGTKISSRLYGDGIGARRVHYRMLDPKTDTQLCIVGRTNGDMLERDDTLDVRPIFEDAVQKSDVVKDNAFYTILGIVIIGGICLVVIFLVIPRMFMG